MKVKYRIVSAFMMLTVMLLASLCIFVYIYTAYQLKQNFIIKLDNRAKTTATIYFKLNESNSQFLAQLDSATHNLLYSESINIYKKSKLIYHFSRFNEDTITFDELQLKSVLPNKQMIKVSKDRMSIIRMFQHANEPIIVSVSAVDMSSKKMLQKLLFNLSIAFILGVFFSAITGLYFSDKLLEPLVKLTNKVKSISANNLKEKLVESDVNDEWNNLNRTFNDLLGRLEDSFAIQSRFISNASHEMSTPLTSVGNQIDVSLQKERSNEEYRKVLYSIRDDIKHMTSLTQQLLQIATSSSGGGVHSEILRIDEIIMDLPSYIRKITPEYNVKINIEELPDNEELCTLLGNYELLFAAFKNVTENGCKYSPQKLINIYIKFFDKHIELLFINHSDSISVDELENIFQPFQRGSNVQNIKGYGLGLSLTRRLILIHKGEIRATLISDNQLCISIKLPNIASNTLK